MTTKVAQKAPFIVPQPEEVDDAVLELFYALTRDLGRPFRASRKNVRHIVGGWDPLSKGFSPLDTSDFLNSYMPAHFFDRYLFSDDDSKKLERTAYKKFMRTCEEGTHWNAFFAPGAALPNELNSVLMEASLICQRVLGEFSHLDVFKACNHGPGASIGVPFHRSQLDSKVTSLTMTPALHDVFLEYLKWDTTMKRELSSYLPKKEPDAFVQGSKLSFVPKKFDSLRTMLVEPTQNQYFQLGTGEVIAKRLIQGAGIDLETQQFVHQDLTLFASKYGILATIDWSAASDRLWINLVRRLLPADWFAWLGCIRSSHATYQGKSIRLEMIGTMGNGFTFPLQTLIFYSLLRGLARFRGKSEFVTVFGDDCIVDANLVPDIEWLAEMIGFKINLTKSYAHGGFRESCGMDAWRGVGCRPFMVERPLCANAPFLRAWIYNCFNGLQSRYTHVSLAECLQWVINYHSKWSLGGVLIAPPRFSTTSGIHTDTPERLHSSTPTIVTDKHGGTTCSVLRVKPIRLVVDQRPYYLWSLAGKGLPKLGFSKKGIEEEVDYNVDSTGHVPGKQHTYVVRDVHVHTWKYTA